MDGTDAPVTDLFCQQVQESGPNALSAPERQALVTGYLAWFRKLARQHTDKLRRRGWQLDVEDVEGEAFLAASEASMYYRAELGVKFGTFATAWIGKHFTRLYDVRLTVPTVGLEFPDRQEARGESEDIPADPEPDAEQRRFLGNLPEPTRSIVRLSVFSRLSPDQIAEQLGMPVKDVKLEQRNAAAKLGRAVGVGEAVDGMIRASGNVCGVAA
jgi:RNA polymerase sigma factor (sigma-70 family)